MDWEESFQVPFPRERYNRSTLAVARDLLGAVLLRKIDRRILGVRLVETEAYTANDSASHAYRGPTNRNRAMFGRPGTLYVYRIHQVHCANVVTRPGQAVLLRAGEPVASVSDRTEGPGRLCRALRITREDDARDLTHGPIRIVPGAGVHTRVVRGPRVGIHRNVDARYRFAIAGDPWVSRPRPPGW